MGEYVCILKLVAFGWARAILLPTRPALSHTQSVAARMLAAQRVDVNAVVVFPQQLFFSCFLLFSSFFQKAQSLKTLYFLRLFAIYVGIYAHI